MHDNTPGALCALTATQALHAMQTGVLRAEAYAQALLARAQALQHLNAFITLDEQAVLAAARTADLARLAGRPVGLLNGLPIAIKDSINTRNLPTSNGTLALRAHRPSADAPLAARLFAQGAICLGKTNMTELSFGWTSNNGSFGPVRNPHDPRRIPGGSSGGSAAAVAAGIAPLALAADTLGSIRVPAAMCGVYGLRPTHGRYPGEGIFSLTHDKLDQAGPMARSVADLALFDAVQTGQTPTEPLPSLQGVRLGVAAFHDTGLDPAIHQATHEAYRRLEDAGAVLVHADLSTEMQAAFDVAAVLMLHEALPSITRFLAGQGTGLDFDQLFAQIAPPMQDFLRATALPPHRPPEDAWLAMLTKRTQVQTATARHFRDHQLDALVYPAISALPAPIGEESEATIAGRKVSFFEAYGRNTALGPVARLASLVLPVGMSGTGLPMALEFSSPPGHDRELLALGQTLEQAIGMVIAPHLRA